MHVVVIGAGLAGVSTAYYLHQAGVSVTVVERQPAAGRETSYANGAMLTPSLSDPWNSPGVFGQLIRNLGRADAPMLLHLSALPRLAGWGTRFLSNARRHRFEATYLHNAALARESLRLLGELRTATAIDFDFAEGGILKPFDDPASFAAAVRVARWLGQAGIRHRVLSVSELIELEPLLQPTADRYVGALHFPDDQVGDANLYCVRLAGWLADAGVEFRFGEQALGFALEARSVRALTTPAGALEADAFVLAAGSFSTGLGRQLKLRLPVVPAKGYSITLDSPILPRYPVVDAALHAAVVPLGRRLRVAGTAEFAGFDQAVRERRIANLTGLLSRIYPQIEQRHLDLNAWAGLRPMPADGRPLLGQAGPANFYLNTGHGALGWTLANASGKVVADQILGEPPAMDTEPFLAGRICGRRK